jgi:predicted esterase YcpF (UPF0227 family)
MRAMKSVLYLHGFASSPRSAKLLELRPIVAAAGIDLNSPDLNCPSFGELCYAEMVRTALEAAAATPPVAIVGSSLGSLVALGAIARGLQVPAVLIAPALGISDLWKDRLPAEDPVMVMHSGFEMEMSIHRPFFDEMTAVRVDQNAPPVPVTVLMGDDDESVPFERVERTWQRWSEQGLQPGSKFIRIAGGDHRLTGHIDLIARAIIEAAS